MWSLSLGGSWTSGRLALSRVLYCQTKRDNARESTLRSRGCYRCCWILAHQQRRYVEAARASAGRRAPSLGAPPPKRRGCAFPYTNIQTAEKPHERFCMLYRSSDTYNSPPFFSPGSCVAHRFTWLWPGLSSCVSGRFLLWQ